jgi:RHS repeat-associated protein
MVALLSNDGTFYWNHPDHLGSGRKLTDSTGAVRYRGEFDPHGQTLLEVTSGGTGTYANSHKYTGYEREWSTNLDYAKARMFNHNRARFMQPDPLGLGAADVTAPQTLNQYSYVANDPVNFVDPSGLLAILCETRTYETCVAGDCSRETVTTCTIFWGGSGSGGGGGTGIGVTGGGGGGGTQTGGGGGSSGSGLGSLLDLLNQLQALALAFEALQKESCRDLFAGVNPIQLLTSLIGSGHFNFANLGNNNANAVTSPVFGYETVPRADESGGTRLNNIGPVGANITINTSPSSQFQSGYNNRFGVSDAVNRAITIIHELGHAANIIKNGGFSPAPGSGSRILNDAGGTPLRNSISRGNSSLVRNACF